VLSAKKTINSPQVSAETSALNVSSQALSAWSLCELLHGAATKGAALCGAQPLGRGPWGDGWDGWDGCDHIPSGKHTKSY